MDVAAVLDPPLPRVNHTSGAHFYANSTQQIRQIQENRIKIMIANSKIKDKFKTMLKVIRALVLDFALYLVTE